jgi:hypothetical protein
MLGIRMIRALELPGEQGVSLGSELGQKASGNDTESQYKKFAAEY